MALPLNTINAQQVFSTFSEKGANVQNIAKLVQGASIQANLLATLLSLSMDLVSYVDSVVADATLTANLVAYVQQITTSTTVAVDFAASHAALSAMVAAILADYPKDAAGHPLDRLMDASGNINWTVLTPAQLPNTLSAIAAWLATVA
ncbi:MAG: hypothetical protein KGL42_08710 [Betaproteobacteria bacterium]|nr:hypothetical protein [Betaproteobacteria bacterium]